MISGFDKPKNIELLTDPFSFIFFERGQITIVKWKLILKNKI